VNTGNHTDRVSSPRVLVYTRHQSPDETTGRFERRALDDIVAEIYDRIYQSTRMHPSGTKVLNQFSFDICDDNIDMIVSELRRISQSETPSFLRRDLNIAIQMDSKRGRNNFNLLVTTTA
jgi:hypothetical protein